jgi:hypothetical protein
MPDDNTAAIPPAEEPKTPAPWGDDFNAERAWKLIENLRADNAKSKARVTEFETAAQARADAEKSELERAVARAEAAEKSLADREAAGRRKDVLSKHGLTDDDAAYLAGISDDELDAKAEALAARLGLTKKDAAEEIPGKPAPKLTPGHETGDAAGDFDPMAIAKAIS